jgi:hypothetical protein
VRSCVHQHGRWLTGGGPGDDEAVELPSDVSSDGHKAQRRGILEDGLQKERSKQHADHVATRLKLVW